MSEIMRPMPFGQLMGWALEEYGREERIFGINKAKFYKNGSGASLQLFGSALGTPIGPAAGPNSQLAQNIVAAWLCGSRFIELKTVQTMDGDALRACVPRPCINAQDEGYNVEWSTELTVQQAFDEYVKAWVAIHVLAAQLGLDSQVVFNMSVGYDLEGIRSEKIDSYIEGMKNAADTPVFRGALAWLEGNSGRLSPAAQAAARALPAQVSRSVTLSTLHGCPPDEIERIAAYLLDEKGVHTFVKCNPTLLGYQTARGLLDNMGYGYIAFDEHHFENDLQYTDALAMLGRLMEKAAGHSLAFGVKITNTFPVKITAGTLPGEEMYMSGRALFPLSITVAARLARDFEGRLPISYSGGADAFNIADIFQTGIRPITVATTILKPGGYERLAQLAATLQPLVPAAPDVIDVAALEKLAADVTGIPVYRKEKRPVASRKTASALPLFDCFKAPCSDGGCPIGQQIPAYLQQVAAGNMDAAFRIIAMDNAAPSITGTLCPHPCQNKCTRLDYDDSLQIRAAKLAASENAQQRFISAISPAPLATAKRVAVVGAGPGGIAAAGYLRRAGVAVTVYEKREKPFGAVEYLIPGFRIPPEAIRRDYEMALRAGVDFRFGTEITDIPALMRDFDCVVLAIGAWREGATAVREGGENLRDALAFLEESKAKNCALHLGKSVAVIGGGDVAMDCARAAKRAPGVEEVTIVYRRTRQYMPAAREEIDLALADGVRLMELYAPSRCAEGDLECQLMELGDWDQSGRRAVTPTGETVNLRFDTIISAVGARVDGGLFEAAGLALGANGLPGVDESCESSLPGVFVVGDCKLGPATIVNAMGDAKKAAKAICARFGIPDGFESAQTSLPCAELYARKGTLRPAGATAADDAARCLGCDSLCEVCCDVCPNRANVRVTVPGFADRAQILHVDSLCNECGNCGVFCTHKGDPYKDKLTLFGSREDFEDSANTGFLPMADGQFMIRMADGETLVCAANDKRVPEDFWTIIEVVVTEHPYLLGGA